jgi:opacity protein-like surface antigen
MTGRMLIKVCLAAMGMGLASPALAADYDGQLPGEGFNGMWSCLYARMDGGWSFFPGNPNAYISGASPVDPETGVDGQEWYTNNSSFPTLENTGFFEGGVGCQVSDAMRVEMVGGLNLKSSLAEHPMPPGDQSYLDGDFSARYVFVSGYWDITNYAGFTPYVGGGIGASYNELSGNHVSTEGTGTPLMGSIDGGNYDFAYHVTFGMSYDVTQSLKFDIAYRYVNFGSSSGSIKYPEQADCGSGVPCSPIGSLDVGTIDAHQVKVGLRYQFGQNNW